MAEALARTEDLAAVDLPREVWSKGKRPVRGVFIRVSFALSLVLIGVAVPVLAGRIAAIAAGVFSFFLVPPLVDGWLDRFGTKLVRFSKSEAHAELKKLEQRRLVVMFAPHAWISWQKGRLHLLLQDGRAAAVAFGEAARQLGDVKLPALVAAQAQGYVLSGDRKQARELLVDLEDRDALRPWDRLNLGVVYIEEPGKAKRALEHLLEAKDVFPEHPRVQAALALVYARLGEAGEATEQIAALEGNDALEDDDAAQDLLKRARKDIRPLTGRKAKKKARDAAPAEDKSDEPEPKRSKARSKKDRRKDRRDRRREKKAEQERKAAAAKQRREAEDAAKREKKKKKKEPDAVAAEPPKKESTEEQSEAAALQAALEKAVASADAQAKEPEPAKAKAPEPAKPKAPEPAKPKAPPVTFEGPESKPVFRPPAVPPPPKVGPPQVGDKKPNAPTTDGWDDLFGDD